MAKNSQSINKNAKQIVKNPQINSMEDIQHPMMIGGKNKSKTLIPFYECLDDDDKQLRLLQKKRKLVMNAYKKLYNLRIQNKQPKIHEHQQQEGIKQNPQTNHKITQLGINAIFAHNQQIKFYHSGNVFPRQAKNKFSIHQFKDQCAEEQQQQIQKKKKKNIGMQTESSFLRTKEQNKQLIKKKFIDKEMDQEEEVVVPRSISQIGIQSDKSTLQLFRINDPLKIKSNVIPQVGMQNSQKLLIKNLQASQIQTQKRKRKQKTQAQIQNIKMQVKKLFYHNNKQSQHHYNSQSSGSNYSFTQNIQNFHQQYLNIIQQQIEYLNGKIEDYYKDKSLKNIILQQFYMNYNKNGNKNRDKKQGVDQNNVSSQKNKKIRKQIRNKDINKKILQNIKDNKKQRKKLLNERFKLVMIEKDQIKDQLIQINGNGDMLDIIQDKQQKINYKKMDQEETAFDVREAWNEQFDLITNNLIKKFAFLQHYANGQVQIDYKAIQQKIKTKSKEKQKIEKYCKIKKQQILKNGEKLPFKKYKNRFQKKQYNGKGFSRMKVMDFASLQMDNQSVISLQIKKQKVKKQQQSQSIFDSSEASNFLQNMSKKWQIQRLQKIKQQHQNSFAFQQYQQYQYKQQWSQLQDRKKASQSFDNDLLKIQNPEKNQSFKSIVDWQYTIHNRYNNQTKVQHRLQDNQLYMISNINSMIENPKYKYVPKLRKQWNLFKQVKGDDYFNMSQEMN